MNLLNRFLILTITVVLLSCQSRTTVHVDPKLRPYLEKFLELCTAYRTNCESYKDYSIKLEEFKPNFIEKLFGLFNENVVGVCNVYTKTITIKKQWHDSYKSLYLYSFIENVMFHEFGHCLLNKDHDEVGSFKIMAPSTLSIGYVENYQLLVDDFFGCEKDCPSVYFDFSKYFRK